MQATGAKNMWILLSAIFGGHTRHSHSGSVSWLELEFSGVFGSPWTASLLFERARECGTSATGSLNPSSGASAG